ncbi:MAG: hypothetical protein K6G45_05410 [Lachnospiraceae bacterium]|nr:hypothetical protein [Lachnospiraceae bacterium]
MNSMPEVTRLDDGSAIWTHRFNTFEATVYVPANDKEDEILNYGYLAPYLLVFAPKHFSFDEAVAFAKENGFEKLAADFATSVVYIWPASGDGWKNADKGIFAEILSVSAIHQYYKDGYVRRFNRFTRQIDDYRIRGAIFRTNLFGFGESADYIALNCLNHFEGDGLWGRADSAPVTCILSGLSVDPVIEADDIPIISIGNCEKINSALSAKAKYLLIKDKADIYGDFYAFSRKFRRMLGILELDPDLEAEGLITEPGIETVKTSPDDRGDDRDTETHKVGYFAFYNKGLFENGPVPLLITFHGGGDSAFYIAHISGWASIAHEHGFLLVSIENHLNSTATEMVELIGKLKEKYSIDTGRIYCSGFSMGGCKSWDMVGEYPSVLAAAAPMDATFEVGLNSYGEPSLMPLNTTVPVPVFYSGGEITPLPELPFQAQKCIDRIKYVLELNKTGKEYDVKLEDKDNWKNKIWGIDGDYSYRTFDSSRQSTLTIEMFNSSGKCYTALSSVSGQGHECRKHTCENAWRFMSNFRRLPDGKIEGGDFDTIKKSFTEEKGE